MIDDMYIRDSVVHKFDENVDYLEFPDMEDCCAFTIGMISYQPLLHTYIDETEVDTFKRFLNGLKSKCFRRDMYYCIKEDDLIKYYDTFIECGE